MAHTGAERALITTRSSAQILCPPQCSTQLWRPDSNGQDSFCKLGAPAPQREAFVSPNPEDILGLDTLQGQTLQAPVGGFSLQVRVIRLALRGSASWDQLVYLQGGWWQSGRTQGKRGMVRERHRVVMVRLAHSAFNSPVWP